MKWKYEDISERSGYSIGTVARLFQGENVRMQTFEDICEAMGVEVRVV